MLSVLLKFKLIMSKFIITVRTTAPVLLADYVSTGDGLKMASTAAYNLSDNHRYSIANFNFNLTLIRCSN